MAGGCSWGQGWHGGSCRGASPAGLEAIPRYQSLPASAAPCGFLKAEPSRNSSGQGRPRHELAAVPAAFQASFQEQAGVTRSVTLPAPEVLSELLLLLLTAGESKSQGEGDGGMGIRGKERGS